MQCQGTIIKCTDHKCRNRIIILIGRFIPSIVHSKRIVRVILNSIRIHHFLATLKYVMSIGSQSFCFYLSTNNTFEFFLTNRRTSWFRWNINVIIMVTYYNNFAYKRGGVAMIIDCGVCKRVHPFTRSVYLSSYYDFEFAINIVNRYCTQFSVLRPIRKFDRRIAIK